ncbi:MAG: hypothetical protein II649_04350 [Kiritimatiellae bacterium]|nr:hypothetical protein [Kiritimatiellia bacterium]
MVKMPGVTLAAFILGYIDVISRFVAWANGSGGLLIKLIFLFVVIMANAGQKWARIVWTVWIGVGILVSLFFIDNAESMILMLVFCGLVLPIVQMILLWHPATTAWFECHQ